MKIVGRLEKAKVVPILRLDREPDKPHWKSQFPDLSSINAKIDTGAKSNSIRVEAIEYKEKNGIEYVAYKLGGVWSPFIEYERRRVRSSNGETENRPRIMCWVTLGIGEKRITSEYSWFTITANTKMTHPILIGRDLLTKHKLSVNSWETFRLGIN